MTNCHWSLTLCALSLTTLRTVHLYSATLVTWQGRRHVVQAIQYILYMYNSISVNVCLKSMCVCVYIYIYIYICIYMCTHLCLSILRHFSYMHLCIFVDIHMCTCSHVHMYNRCTHANIHIHIYLYAYIYIYIYIHIRRPYGSSDVI